jgi:hypothetical protein
VSNVKSNPPAMQSQTQSGQGQKSVDAQQSLTVLKKEVVMTSPDKSSLMGISNMKVII